MKRLFAGLMALLAGGVATAVPLPPEVCGIWASPGSEFRGDALWNGQAIYLDVDGVGAFVGGNGSDVLGVRVVVTSYDSASGVVALDLTEHGKVLAHESITFDKEQQALITPKDSKRYFRRAKEISATMRKALGLEPLQASP